MIIYQDLVLDWKSGAFRGHFDPKYFGPVAYAGGGSDTSVTNEVVPTGPWGPQIPWITGFWDMIPGIIQDGPPQAYGGPLTPGINQNLQQSWDIAGAVGPNNINQNLGIQQDLQNASQGSGAREYGQGFRPGIQQGINQQQNAFQNSPLLNFYNPGLQGAAQNSLQTVFNQGPNVIGDQNPYGTQAGQTDISQPLQTLLQGGGGQNPFLADLVQGAVQTQVDQFNRNVLPGIRSDAGQAGQPGGTRQGIAEGIAAGDLTNSIGNITSSIYGNAFDTQANLQGQAVGNLVQAQQGDQSANVQGEGLTNQSINNWINNLLGGSNQVQQGLGQGTGQAYDAVGTGTAQAGNIYNQGNVQGLNEFTLPLSMIPSFQNSSIAQGAWQNTGGAQQYGYGQNAIDALMNQYYFNQNSPYNWLSQIQQYITGPYGSSTGDPRDWMGGANPFAGVNSGRGPGASGPGTGVPPNPATTPYPWVPPAIPGPTPYTNPWGPFTPQNPYIPEFGLPGG